MNNKVSHPTVERIDFHGWDGLRLRNGLIEAVCVPEIGGRLMQFRLGRHDFLFMNPDLLGKRFTFEEHAGDGTIPNWKNYGGDKTWPAPQGWDNAQQWHGPARSRARFRCLQLPQWTRLRDDDQPARPANRAANHAHDQP